MYAASASDLLRIAGAGATRPFRQFADLAIARSPIRSVLAAHETTDDAVLQS